MWVIENPPKKHREVESINAFFTRVYMQGREEETSLSPNKKKKKLGICALLDKPGGGRCSLLLHGGYIEPQKEHFICIIYTQGGRLSNVEIHYFFR